ncbi:MAG: nucleotide exchange factor GrpE [Chloroflexi bacterium]|nr:MAG: nucleotide exchange factor GrpE [Chloroflexota bacterium]
MKKNKDQNEQSKQEELEVSEKEEPILENEELEGQPPVPAKELSLEEQVESLQSSLDEMTAKAEEYLDGWQRARAEFANYKKRVLKENTEIHQVARGDVIKIYLDILDDLERALAEKPTQGDGKSWSEGIELIVQKLHSRLEAEGVKPMNPLGEEFNPNFHEALMKEESDEYKSGQIIEVMQEGYWIGDKVLRPALVRVAA